MITYAVLQQQKPRVCTSLTGLTLAEFDELYTRIEPLWRDREQKQEEQRSRRRAPGGGRSYSLGLREQLLMTLLGQHLSLNTAALGFLFGIDKSTVSRNTRHILAALNQLAPADAPPIRLPGRGQGQTIDQALQAHPDLQALVFENQPGVDGPLANQRGSDTIIALSEPAPQTTQLIGQLPPFQNLSPAELETVQQAAYVRQVERQAFFYHQGDRATAFYILLEGQLRLTEVTLEGQQLLVRFVSPGEAIGIIAVLQDSVYPLAAQAVEDCRALAWESAALEQLMERIPRIAINGLRLVSRRWHELEERYRELATERVERRIAQTLLRLLNQVGRRVDKGILIDLPLSRQDLAEMTGTTLYTVSRIISRWEQAQLVETRRDRLLVRFPHGLAAIAEDLPPENPA